MKYLVETPGDFSLYDLLGQQSVAAFRPSVVKATPFIESQRGTKLNVLEVLSDEAEDEPLARARTDAELEEAIANLPRAKAASRDPLDHDGDGRKGGSVPRAARKK